MSNKLYIFCGIPFSGKTTLAKEVVKVLGFKRIDLDEIKFDFFGKDIKDGDINQKGWNTVYQEMYKRIEESLRNGETVIHDTGNFTKVERDLVRKIADKLRIEAVAVYVDTSKKIAKGRLMQNRQTSQRFDVSSEAFESTVAEMEVPDKDEKHITYNGSMPIDAWIKDKFKN